MSPVVIMAACPITFSSSRTLPGHECRESRICARCVSPRIVFLVLRGEPRNEMPLEQRKIFFAIRQPRRLNFHHGETVVQILPKTFLGDGGPQVVIRGGNDANIHFAGAQRSHSLHFLILEHAQELRLRGERHISDLIQKQRASMGVLEQARLVVRGPGERTLHVAEQLALEQRFHDGRAVEHDVAAGSHRAEPVERAGDQVFTRPGLPRDQQRPIVRSHAPDAPEHFPHLRAAADDSFELRVRLAIRPRAAVRVAAS